MSIHGIWNLSRTLLVQAACTAKELKELVSMPSIAISANPDQLAVSDADKAEMKAVRLKRRIFELISKVRTLTTFAANGSCWQLRSALSTPRDS